MSVFLIALIVGLAGLVLMALPAMHRHGRGGRAHAGHGGRGRGRAGQVAHSHGHAGNIARSHGHAGHAVRSRGGHQHAAPRAAGRNGVVEGLLNYFPEPRLLFTVMALFGAFGNLLASSAHLPSWAAGLAGLAIAIVLEWLVVGRLWRFAFGFSGDETTPLEALVMDHAEAVTAFRNGRGIVRVVRDGRAVQLTAELKQEDRNARIHVGDKLTIEEVDGDRERVVVSIA